MLIRENSLSDQFSGILLAQRRKILSKIIYLKVEKSWSCFPMRWWKFQYRCSVKRLRILKYEQSIKISSHIRSYTTNYLMLSNLFFSSKVSNIENYFAYDFDVPKFILNFLFLYVNNFSRVCAFSMCNKKLPAKNIFVCDKMQKIVNLVLILIIFSTFSILMTDGKGKSSTTSQAIR